jgi:hypothetical protein
LAAKIREADERSRNAMRATARLRTRIAELENDVQECRNLNKRLAEVVDVFVEVLVPAEHRDIGRFTQPLNAYGSTISPDLTNVGRSAPLISGTPGMTEDDRQS